MQLQDDTASVHQLNSDTATNDYARTCALAGSCNNDDDDELVCCRVEQLLAFNNKLRLSLRSLYSAQCQRLRLKHQLYESTSGGIAATSQSVNHLSMFEVYMLRHPDVLHKNLELLERDSCRLLNLLRWKELENIFWRLVGVGVGGETVCTSC